MSKNPSCRNCGKEIDRNNCYKFNERSYYCNEDCYNEKFEKNKQKYKPAKEKPVGVDNPRRLYSDYIQSVYMENGYDKKQIPWELIFSQTKNLMKEHEVWKYEGNKSVKNNL